MNRILRRTLTVPLASLALVGLTASSAFAHECFNASRSSNGNVNAANSGNWEYLTIADIFGFYGLEGDDLATALVLADERGLPEDLTIFTRHTLKANPKTGEPTPALLKHATDGTGIDHVFSVEGGLVDQVEAIVAEVTTAV